MSRPIRNPHRIRRQRWEVRAPDQATAFALRTQLRHALDDVWLPAISQAFDAMGVDEDTVCHLPQLRLHLRVDSLEALVQQLPTALDEQLRALFTPSPHHSVQRLSRQIQQRASLIHYLSSGQLDWPDQHGDRQQQAAVLRQEAQHLLEDPLRALETLRAALPANLGQFVAGGFRLLQLLPVAERHAWLQTLHSHHAPPSNTAAFWQALAKIGPAPSAASGVPPLNPSSLSCRASPDLFTISPHHVLQGQTLYLALMLLDPSNLNSLRQQTKAILPLLPDLPDVAAQALATAMDTLIPLTSADPVMANAISPIVMPHATSVVPVPPAPDRPSPPPPSLFSDSAERAATAAMRLPSAGLILAHPFITPLFTACGVLDPSQQQFLPMQQARAAALLHWLAYGQAEPYEFELGLIKLLLGLPPQAPLLLSTDLLSADDHTECTALLTAVIAHWPALRNTSIAGLQTAFLQRTGWLQSRDAGWHLQLETESFDMLLASLPWSISIVKLPWMTRPIFTDWQTP